jgi:hypothetical protein
MLAAKLSRAFRPPYRIPESTAHLLTALNMNFYSVLLLVNHTVIKARYAAD